MSQPSYFCIANLGDADPFEHGGAFVCIDRRGIYDPILLIYDQDLRKRSEITLEPCHRICKNLKERLISVGANNFHPDIPEWFSDSLSDAARFCGQNFYDFVSDLISTNVVKRAGAYLNLAHYHGVFEFVHYPHIYEDEKDAERFCDKMLAQIEESKSWWDGYFDKED